MVVLVFKYVVERHESGAHLGVALSAPKLRLRVANQPVDGARAEVVDVPALLIVQECDVAGDARLLQKPHDDRTSIAVDEVVELAAEEVAGVRGHKIQKRGFAFGVAERLKRDDGIDSHAHSSKMFSMR